MSWNSSVLFLFLKHALDFAQYRLNPRILSVRNCNISKQIFAWRRQSRCLLHRNLEGLDNFRWTSRMTIMLWLQHSHWCKLPHHPYEPLKQMPHITHALPLSTACCSLLFGFCAPKKFDSAIIFGSFGLSIVTYGSVKKGCCAHTALFQGGVLQMHKLIWMCIQRSIFSFSSLSQI